MWRKEVWSFNMTAMQQSFFSFTYNYGHLYNLVWRENTGTETHDMAGESWQTWKKKRGETLMIYKECKRRTLSLNPLRRWVNAYNPSVYIWDNLWLQTSKASSWDYRSKCIFTDYTNWSCLEMHNSNFACTWGNIIYPIYGCVNMNYTRTSTHEALEKLHFHFHPQSCKWISLKITESTMSKPCMGVY